MGAAKRTDTANNSRVLPLHELATSARQYFRLSRKANVLCAPPSLS
jgi:hypothetical protein